MKRINIFHIDTGLEWRGGQSQVLMLVRGLNDMGVSNTIFTRKGSALAERARDAGLDCHELPFRFEIDLLSVRQIVHIAHGREPLLFHAHTPHGLGITVLAREMGLRVPILFTRRVSFPIRNRLLNQWKLKQADRLIAVSSAVADRLVEGGLDPRKIRVIHSSIDVKEFPYSGPCEELPYAIGIGGAMEKAKGIHRAVEFVWKSKHLPVQFHFAGSGKDMESLKLQLSKASVSIHGFVRDMAGFLRRMFLVFSFSPSEGFPNFLLQAMATGVPVIALRNEATSELLGKNEYGFLFDQDQEALALLEQIIAEPTSLRGLSLRASEYVRTQFSSDRMVQQTFEVYKECVS